MHALHQGLLQTLQTHPPHQDAHRGEALLLLHLREGLLRDGPLQSAREDARGAAGEAARVRALPDELLQGLGAAAPRPLPHGGEALPLQRVRELLLPLGGAEEAHEQAHGREAARLFRLREALLFWAGPKDSQAHSLRGEAAPLPRLRQRLLAAGEHEGAPAERAQQAGEVPVRPVRGQLRPLQDAEGAPARAHGGEALPVPHVRTQVLVEPLSEQTPQDPRWRPALRGRRRGDAGEPSGATNTPRDVTDPTTP